MTKGQDKPSTELDNNDLKIIYRPISLLFPICNTITFRHIYRRPTLFYLPSLACHLRLSDISLGGGIDDKRPQPINVEEEETRARCACHACACCCSVLL